MREKLSRADARRVALAAQGFGRARSSPVGTRQLNLAVRRMGVLQIDSVNVYARSHYMPLFSRLGPYDTTQLDKLLFARRAPYVESWAHMASFIPAEDWGLFEFRREAFREKFSEPDSWFATNRATVDWVRAELAARGPLRPAQIESDAHGQARGPWWDWNEVKQALEHLWFLGEVAIAGRRGFERVYGLAEHVIPADVLANPIARDDALPELVRRAAIAYGVVTIADLDDFWRLRDQRAVKRIVGELEEAGELVPVKVEGWMIGGRPARAWMHRDAALPRRVDAAAILSPFDPVVWFRDRAERLFDFDYRIEIYTPAARRRFGYYSLPVLVGDDVVGRVDLKADRAASRLLVQSAWWEPGRPADAPERLARQLQDAATWQGLEQVSVSSWGDAADDLARALPGAARHAADRNAPADESAPAEGPADDAEAAADAADAADVLAEPVSA